VRARDAFSFALSNIVHAPAFFIANVLAVGVGVALIAIMLSLSTGIRRYIENGVATESSLLTIEVMRDRRDPRSHPIGPAELHRMSAIGGVTGVHPVVSNVFGRLAGAEGETWVSLWSGAPNDPEIRRLEMLAGRPDPRQRAGIILPETLVRELGIHPPASAVARTLTLRMQRTAGAREEVIELPVVVTGVARTTRSDRAYMPLAVMRWLHAWQQWNPVAGDRLDAASLASVSTAFRYETVLIDTRHTAGIPQIRALLEQWGYGTASILDSIRRYREILDMITLVLGTIGAVSLFAGSTSIFNAAYASVLRNLANLAVFKAFGATPFGILLILLAEAVITALVAGTAGFATAWAVCATLQRYASQQMRGAQLFPVEWWLGTLAIALALVACGAATVGPAIKAARTSVITLFRQT
jgi:ABC-type lipoprotein release transport system permease subunit